MAENFSKQILTMAIKEIFEESNVVLFSVVMTSQPTNDSELQLYRVLQRANLLNYYDTFISQGEQNTKYVLRL